MMNEGKIVLDVKGKEKEKRRINDLLKEFDSINYRVGKHEMREQSIFEMVDDEFEKK